MILFLFPPDSTFLLARSAMLSALNETPSARARYVCHKLAAPGTGHSWWCPHWERGMSAAVVASERMQLLGWVKEQRQGTSSTEAAALIARRVTQRGSTRSTLKLSSEWYQWMTSLTITLSICLCPSHRHFPKKLLFFPLQDQIACMPRQDTLTSTEFFLARAFSAVSCWRSVL